MNSVLTETTENRDASAAAGWILYDADCGFCVESASRLAKTFYRRGFDFLPLRTPWIQDQLGLKPDAPLEEMRVLTRDGHDYGGADAVVFLARKVWWSWPFYALAQLPGAPRLIDRGYRWIAAHRGCTRLAVQVERPRSWPAWLGLFLFPPLALIARNYVAPRAFMWFMASAIFFGCKRLTLWGTHHKMDARTLAYLFLWPGMDARNFLTRRIRNAGSPIFALTKALFGTLLLFVVARRVHPTLLAG